MRSIRSSGTTVSRSPPAPRQLVCSFCHTSHFPRSDLGCACTARRYLPSHRYRVYVHAVAVHAAARLQRQLAVCCRRPQAVYYKARPLRHVRTDRLLQRDDGPRPQVRRYRRSSVRVRRLAALCQQFATADARERGLYTHVHQPLSKALRYLRTVLSRALLRLSLTRMLLLLVVVIISEINRAH